ncbi:MAG TPA: TonB-dependent receptor [Vicinamibacterales bacterium]|nr:TonB-dependent receptor [Vicinamibacterales bacterium]
MIRNHRCFPLHILLLSLALLLLVVPVARAQLAGGTIRGTVTDTQGGVLPGATVTLQGPDVTQIFTTEGTGQYRFLDLAPGTYKLTIELQSFATFVRDRVVVEVGKTVDLPDQMRVGGVAETVNVTAASPIIDTKATGTATNVTEDELKNIPTSRDVFSLMRSVPGVLVDRVNVGGNETGQQLMVVSKGTRPQDVAWTMDGVVITDMNSIAVGQSSPTYFNFDNFQEIQVSTAGQDILEPTGGVGLNMVVKRGINQFHGAVREYFENSAMESGNVPAELRAAGVTPATADHTSQLDDYGGEFGGPIVKDKAWFYGSYSYQDVRLVRHAGNLNDRTRIKNPDLKLNWQATRKDMVSFLFFNGDKVKDYRSPGNVLFDAPTATYHQSNAYSGNPLHGLWKFADDRIITPNIFLSAKYAYYNTGFSLTPEGGMGLDAGRNTATSQSFGSTVQSLNVRPQRTVNLDLGSFLNALGASHDFKYGYGWRRVDATTGTLWPGDGVLALQQSPTTLFAEVFRQGLGTNRGNYMDAYVSDTIARNRTTINLGLRYDRQSGSALPSVTQANPAFPALVPGLSFAGYRTPFTWNNLSPRIGVAYAVDESRKTVARLSYSRFAGQLDTSPIGPIGFANPTATAGTAVYTWTDLNGDHLAQPNEVNTSQFVTSAGGFNPANPTAVTSSNVIDPKLKAPRTQSVVAGMDRELLPNLALQVSYTYSRTSNLYGNVTGSVTPRVGMTTANYTAGPTLTGTLPNGAAYSVPTFIPDPALVTAGGGGFVLTNWNGYYTDYHGLEVNVVKRLSNRWMERISFSYNNAREHYTPQARYDTNGNPTPTITEPLVDGGQFAPQSSGDGLGSIFINAKWQFNANGLYQGPFGIDLAANVFGRQGYPNPMFQSQKLGQDTSLPVLVTPQIDTFRYPNVWDADIRIARAFQLRLANLRLMADLFNVANANTALVRNNNILSPTFNALAQNLSPRILRVGLVFGF